MLLYYPVCSTVKHNTFKLTTSFDELESVRGTLAHSLTKKLRLMHLCWKCWTHLNWSTFNIFCISSGRTQWDILWTSRNNKRSLAQNLINTLLAMPSSSYLKAQSRAGGRYGGFNVQKQSGKARI